MIIIDILVWMAVARAAVLMFEDAAYAARGKQSPRRRARAEHEAAQAAGRPVPKPVGGWGRTTAAVGGYMAGLVEDATAGARARRRRALARRRGAQAVDGVFVDVDDDGGFCADCDLCGWASRPFRIEANARGAGREHTRTEHPDAYHPDPADTPKDDRSAAPDESVAETQPGPTGPGPEAEGRPQLRVIPGGRQDGEQPAAPSGQEQPAADPQTGKRRCGRCVYGQIVGTRPWPGSPGSTADADHLCNQCGWLSSRISGKSVDERAAAPLPTGYAFPAPQRTEQPRQSEPRPAPPAEPEPTYGWGCHTCDAHQGGFASEDAARADAATHSCPAADTPQTGAGNPAGARMKEITVNLDATGPEEIRTAFTEAKTTTGERGEEIIGLAGVLVEAADRFEQLEMAGSTVELMREASESLKAGAAALEQASEHLEAALADFNAKDGHVADTAADVGNLASKDVLVGS